IENGLGPEHWNSAGWDPSHLAEPSHLTGFAWGGMWTDISASTRKALLEAYLRNWMNKNKQYAAWEYYTGDYGGLTKSSYVPVYGGEAFGDNIVTMLSNTGPGGNGYSLKAFGVDTTLQNEILDWAKTMWPSGNWDSLRP